MNPFSNSELVPSRVAAEEFDRLAGSGGLYAIFSDPAQLLLERSGYMEFDQRPLLNVGGFDLLYLGATVGSLRQRVRCHLCGDSRGSSFRQSIGALLADELNLDPESFAGQSGFGFGEGEPRLTKWLMDHTAVVAVPCEDPFRLERELLINNPAPLNITGRRRHRFAKYLTSLKQLYCRRPQSTRQMIRHRTSLGLPPMEVSSVH